MENSKTIAGTIIVTTRKVDGFVLKTLVKAN